MDERPLCFVVPAFQAENSIAGVVRGLLEVTRRAGTWTEARVVVVDDGSTDGTAREAQDTGAVVVRHPHNRGKGRALLTGFHAALEHGACAAISVDADGQHPPDEALKIALDPAPLEALVLAVRDLNRDGAPRANRFSNGFSNVWMSWFARRPLRDTQCGLRRYPLPATLELGLLGSRFELESEVILRAVRSGIPLVEVPARVLYPEQRTSHFRSARDPTRIVFRLLHTAATTPWRRAGRP